MFCFQQMCQQNPVLLISIGLSFASFPFIVTRSIYIHDLAKKTYGISGTKRIDDFELFSLSVTSSLVAPTPFTKYPFLISHFQPPALQPLTLVALFQIDSY